MGKDKPDGPGYFLPPLRGYPGPLTSRSGIRQNFGVTKGLSKVWRLPLQDTLQTSGVSWANSVRQEIFEPLAAAGLAVEDVVVLIDRESGGREELARQGYRLHAVLTLRQILDVLTAGGEIDAQQRATVLDWLAGA